MTRKSGAIMNKNNGLGTKSIEEFTVEPVIVLLIASIVS